MKIFKYINLPILLLIIAIQAMGQITEIGLASFYADKFDGRVTASGEIFDQNKMTAAHRTFPFGTIVKVTNKENNKSVTVIINDRGPFVKDRVIDLSKAAAKKLELTSTGTAQVKVEVVSLGKSEELATNLPKPENTVAVISDKKNTEPASEITPAPVLGTMSPENTMETSAQSSIYEYYKLVSEQIIPTGFGIQIASYQDASNLMKRCDEIRKEVRKDIIIQVGENDGNKVYRIIVGTFATREAATDFNNTLKRSYSGSFVIAF